MGAPRGPGPCPEHLLCLPRWAKLVQSGGLRGTPSPDARPLARQGALHLPWGPHPGSESRDLAPPLQEVAAQHQSLPHTLAKPQAACKGDTGPHMPRATGTAAPGLWPVSCSLQLARGAVGGGSQASCHSTCYARPAVSSLRCLADPLLLPAASVSLALCVKTQKRRGGPAGLYLSRCPRSVVFSRFPHPREIDGDDEAGEGRKKSRLVARSVYFLLSLCFSPGSRSLSGSSSNSLSAPLALTSFTLCSAYVCATVLSASVSLRLSLCTCLCLSASASAFFCLLLPLSPLSSFSYPHLFYLCSVPHSLSLYSKLHRVVTQKWV
ncbi:uncharacterized protein LOC129405584 [Sorex araneus]|uniref:uncharacterized protein LOC129405584 n=1 Tax=Sorex araneus TaxID=42254 RepID=UPI002433F81F|nr:uncharacterized protein LOC129405584 [Sorex araneus]